MRTENRKESGGELSGKSDPCAQGARYDAGGAGGKAEHLAAGGEQVGNGSFPNKRILRNNLCLPACRVLMYKKMTLEI